MAGSKSITKRWRQLPLVWLGIAIFAASLAGCIHLVMIASQYPDESLPASSESLLKMPMHRAPYSPADVGER